VFSGVFRGPVSKRSRSDLPLALLGDVGGDQRNRNTQHDHNVRRAHAEGQEAHAAGKPLWLNPHFGKRARSWSNGWRAAAALLPEE